MIWVVPIAAVLLASGLALVYVIGGAVSNTPVPAMGKHGYSRTYAGAITPDFTIIPYTKRDDNYWPKTKNPSS